jgi:hypothetical protein
MVLWWLFVVLVIVLIGFYFIGFYKNPHGAARETFYVKTMEDEVTDIYLEVLQRQPSGAELIENVSRLNKGTMTLEGLRQRLIQTDEYERTVKTQSNSLAPELERMLSERQIIETIGRIYREERKKDMPDKMMYPLRDIYIELDYNEYAFRAFLRHPDYQEFEDAVMRMVAPTKDDVMALFNKMFDKKKIMEEGARLKREADAAAAAAAGAAKATTGAATDGLAGQNEAAGVRCLSDTDSDSKAMLESIQKTCANLFDKDLEAQCLDKNAKSIILTHHGDMVLRPEYAWSVPQQRAPVCTTFGQKPLVQPVMVNSSLLLGTPLDDAENTQVGSIMPKFKYTEYISVPGDKMPVCSGDSNDPRCAAVKSYAKNQKQTAAEAERDRLILEAKKKADAEAEAERAAWLPEMEKKRLKEEAEAEAA